MTDASIEYKGQVLVYTTTGCPHCKATKSKLDSLNLPYVNVNLDDYPEQRDVMIQLTNKRTVPQLFFSDKHVGGNDDFQKLSQAELDDLIAYVRDCELPAGAPTFVETKLNETAEDPLGKQDDLAELVENFSKQSKIIYDHRKLLFSSNPKTFTGDDFITYIAHQKQLEREEAKEIAQEILNKNFAVPAKETNNASIRDDSTLYRLVHDVPSKALNANIPSFVSVGSASQVSVVLRKHILKMYAKYLSSDGRSVDYAGIGKSSEFEDYKKLTAQLARVQIDGLERHEIIAFFVNIYNALVIHGNIEYGFPENTWQRYKFFNRCRYVIGRHAYSLQDIENGVLRSNRKGVGMLSRPFKESDPRIKNILQPHEALIHFALVCGAKSCPPIKTYTSENIISQLKLSASAFLESDDGCRVDSKQKLIGLSMIFSWYREDFGESAYEVLLWVKQHMADGKKKTEFVSLLDSKQYKLVYLTYDWGTNKK
uniref:Uncharacterized protein LOC100179648 n=1 Tax=Phallusia mammillata TaxID=59560 RepID=A0A6F9DHU0_9ASCI|nr:uncharacterized protein LOC100179648 [Phallusia mammillata]